MTDQNTDPKAQGQGQPIVTEEKEEGHVAFGGSDDFFDDPNFLNKISQGNTNQTVEVGNEDVNLGDISNVFENKINEPLAKGNDNIELENLDLEASETVEEKPEHIVEETIESDLNLDEKPEDTKEDVSATNENMDGETKNEANIEEVPTITEAEADEIEEIAENNEVVNDDKEIRIDEKEEKLDENVSDFVKKFNELKKILSEVYESKTKLGYEGRDFEVIGANSDRNKITYNFGLDDEGAISIQKIELDKTTEEESEHTMLLDIENGGLNIGMDDVIIFEEKKDLQNDQKKKIQVMDKLNKFLFLAGEYQNTLQMELNEKSEEEQERKKMQDIFRNF